VPLVCELTLSCLGPLLANVDIAEVKAAAAMQLSVSDGPFRLVLLPNCCGQV
jgi:hypothetical protein